MISKERMQLSSLPGTSRLTKTITAVVVLLIIVGTLIFYNAKTITVNIDGKTVKVTSITRTVGEALAHSGLGIYPEDKVVPGRDTLITSGMVVNITRSIPVKLSVDGQVIQTRTVQKTVGSALTDLSQRFGLNIKDVDEVNLARTAALAPNTDIVVRRAIPIEVAVDGKTVHADLAPRTLAKAFKKLGITLGSKDIVSQPLNKVIQPNEKIRVVRVTEKEQTIQTEIPYQVVDQPSDFPVGLPDRLVSRGSNGLQEQTVKLTYEDGKQVNRQVLSQKIVSAPVNEVVAKGAQTSISRGGMVIRFKKAYLMRATAYSIPGGITATGASVHWGIVAVDPRVIPLGSSVYVEGYGEASAQDTGSAIQGKRIDLYMNSTGTAQSFGVRNVLVYVE